MQQAIDLISNVTPMDNNPGGISLDVLNATGGGGGTSTTPIVVESDREIAFSVNSSPTNCSIYINGSDSGYKTPHTLIFREKELNTSSKLIEVYNSSTKLTEKYLITAN